MNLSKSEARKSLKAKIAEFTPDIRLKKSRDVSRNILGFLNSQNYSSKGIIGGFAPMHDEVEWLLELDEFADRLAFPGTDENGAMIFFQTRFDDLIATRVFGVTIKSPKTEASIVVPDLLLVPGLGFSRKGERLGRGKGFYDKYLENFNGLKIGICTSEQILNEIPTEDHDIKMDGLITDSEVTIF